MADIKWSAFPDGGAIESGDEVVGLRAGANTRMTANQFDTTISATGTITSSVEGFVSGNETPGGIGGYFKAFSTTANMGSNTFQAIDNSGDFANVLQNAATTDARTWTLPDATGTLSLTESAAGGSTTQIQYNNAGALAGDTGFTTDGAGTETIVGQLNVDNLRLDGNTVSTTNTNGSLVLAPNGVGNITSSRNIFLSAGVNSGVTTNVANTFAGASSYAGYSFTTGPGVATLASYSTAYTFKPGLAGRVLLGSNASVASGILIRPDAGGLTITTNGSVDDPNLLVDSSGNTSLSGSLTVDNLRMDGNSLISFTDPLQLVSSINDRMSMIVSGTESNGVQLSHTNATGRPSFLFNRDTTTLIGGLYAGYAASFGAAGDEMFIYNALSDVVNIRIGTTTAATFDASSLVLNGSLTTAGAISAASLSLTAPLPVTSGGTGLSSTTANQLLYSSATSTIAGLATANDGVLITSGTGVPSISSTLPTTVQTNITRLGTINQSIGLTGNPGGARYLYIPGETTGGTTRLTIQAGGGSASYGGGLSLFGQAHATKPGWVTAGISTGSGGKFSVNDQGTGTGAEVFTVGQTGNVVANGSLTASGINFGQDTLNYYDEGTFTPVLEFGGASVGITYALQAGKYTRIGNVVTIAVIILLSSKGTSTGNATVTGLPVAADPTGTQTSTFYATNLTASVPSVLISPGTTLLVRSLASGGAATSLTNAEFVNSTTISINMSYFTT